MTTRLLAPLGISLALLATPSGAHIEQTQPLQSLRQSYFALLGMTLAPMGDMVKGKIDWNAELFASWARDLDAVAGFGVERGFAPGSEEGTTRAKPEIWLDMADFQSKLENLRAAAAALAEVAGAGDDDATREQFMATAGTCKACHDEYKAKDYLY
jgi:cytochrome c556